MSSSSSLNIVGSHTNTCHDNEYGTDIENDNSNEILDADVVLVVNTSNHLSTATSAVVMTTTTTTTATTTDVEGRCDDNSQERRCCLGIRKRLSRTSRIGIIVMTIVFIVTTIIGVVAVAVAGIGLGQPHSTTTTKDQSTSTLPPSSSQSQPPNNDNGDGLYDDEASLVLRQVYPPTMALDDYYWYLYDRLTMPVTSISQRLPVTGLQDPSTSTYQALEWMAFQDGALWQLVVSANNDNDNDNDNNDNDIILQAWIEQRFAMIVVVIATNGLGSGSGSGNSNSNSGGGSSGTMSMLRHERRLLPGIMECDWYGVICSYDVSNNSIKDNNTGTVIELQWAQSFLIGTLPLQVTWLNQLQILSIEWNRLYSTLPSQLHTMKHLKELYLTSNDFSGPWLETQEQRQEQGQAQEDMPSSSSSSSSSSSFLFFPPQLQILDAMGNQFTGTLPKHLPHTLQDLRIDLNRFEGTIPWKEWSASSTSTTTTTSTTNTTTTGSGSHSHSQLTFLNIGLNALTGLPLTSHIQDFTNLHTISIENNPDMSSVTIPTEIGRLTNLVHFNLNALGENMDNHLYIPTEMYQLTSLKFVNIGMIGHPSYNTIPESTGTGGPDRQRLRQRRQLQKEPFILSPLISQWKQIEQLFITWVPLQGTIPTELGLLTNLQYLDLSRTNLQGSLPTEIGQLTNLEELWIQGTGGGLQGPVPENWCTTLPAINIDFRVDCIWECSCCQFYCTTT